MRFASLLLSFLFAAFGVSAQVNPQCPMVYVTGPRVVSRGELNHYVVTVKPIESKLTYKWTVFSGVAEVGQGTPSVEVRFSPDVTAFTVRVEVGGLPQDCPNTASESTTFEVGPEPLKLDTFSLPLSSVSDKRFESIAGAVDHDPTSQLFVFIPADHIVRDALTKRLYKAIHDFDPSRITYVETATADKTIEVWLVPPGANRPTCENCCPSANIDSTNNLRSLMRPAVKTGPAIKRPLKCPKIQ